jgi:hypothetical protein
MSSGKVTAVQPACRYTSEFQSVVSEHMEHALKLILSNKIFIRTYLF